MFVPQLAPMPGEINPFALEGLAFGGDGNLYASYRSGHLVRYDGATGQKLKTLYVSTFDFRALAFGPGGKLYVLTWSLYNGAGVLRFDITTDAFPEIFVDPVYPYGQWEVDPANLSFASGLAFGPAGDLYMRDGNGNSIKQFGGQSGEFIGYFAQFGPSASGSNVRPYGLAFGPDGDLLVAKQVGLNFDRLMARDRVDGSLASLFDEQNVGGLSMPTGVCFEPREATRYGCDVNVADSLTVLGGSAALNQTLVVGLDNPLGTTPAGALPVPFVSSRPSAAYPCGAALAGYGMSGMFAELLIDVTPGKLVGQALVGAPWMTPGSPVAISLNFPSETNLLFRSFYVQGALVSPGGSVQVTDALAVVVRP